MSFNSVLAGLLLVASGVAWAHHAESLYDLKNPITLKGVVTKVDWSNPHAYLRLSVKSDKGETEAWSVELSSLSTLKRNGWTSATVKVGDEITCTGGRAKGGAKAMRGLEVDLADGRKLKTQ
jgi:hypothetical protein